MSTTFYFVRHGQTHRNTEGRLPDGLNDPLNEKGKEQALETAKNISEAIDIAISSPLARATETLQIICDSLKYDISRKEPDDRLQEANFGDLKGKTWAEVDVLYPGENLQQKYRAQEFDFSMYGGDSYESVKERVYAFIEDMKRLYPGKSILVATHAGIIRCICKTEKDFIFPGAPDNASVHKFIFPDAQKTGKTFVSKNVVLYEKVIQELKQTFGLTNNDVIDIKHWNNTHSPYYGVIIDPKAQFLCYPYDRDEEGFLKEHPGGVVWKPE